MSPDILTKNHETINAEEKAKHDSDAEQKAKDKDKDAPTFSLEQAIRWFNGDKVRAKQMTEQYHNAFATEGFPDGAARRFVDEVFPINAISNMLVELVKKEFHPAHGPQHDHRKDWRDRQAAGVSKTPYPGNPGGGDGEHVVGTPAPLQAIAKHTPAQTKTVVDTEPVAKSGTTTATTKGSGHA